MKVLIRDFESRSRPAGNSRRDPSILVVDIGGSHIKALATGHRSRIKFKSGPATTPEIMVRGVQKATSSWRYTVVSLGSAECVTMCT